MVRMACNNDIDASELAAYICTAVPMNAPRNGRFI